jgi:hypothetical protein
MRECIQATFGIREFGNHNSHVEMWIHWHVERASAFLDTHRAGFWADCRRTVRRLRGC